MGPVCARKAGGGAADAFPHTADMLPEPFSMFGLLCKRDKNGYARTNIPHQIVRHSPTGFEWGYSGSGPAELALNTLALCTSQADAERLYQNFKAEFLAGMPREGWMIPMATINAYLTENKAELL